MHGPWGRVLVVIIRRVRWTEQRQHRFQWVIFWRGQFVFQPDGKLQHRLLFCSCVQLQRCRCIVQQCRFFLGNIWTTPLRQ